MTDVFLFFYTSDATNLLTKPDTIMHHVFISIIFRLTCLAPIDSNIFSSWILNCWTLFINTQGYKKTERDVKSDFVIFFMYHVQCNKCFFSTIGRIGWKKHGRNWQEKKNLQSSLCQYKMENSWSAWHCTAEELWQLSVKTGRNKGM